MTGIDVAVDVEHAGQRQRCGVNVSTGGAKPNNNDSKKGNKGEGKKSRTPTEETSTAPAAAEEKDQEMKDANAETGEQTSTADVPMEVNTLKIHWIFWNKRQGNRCEENVPTALCTATLNLFAGTTR